MATDRTKAAANAIGLLKADHRLVEELFEKYETTKGGAAKAKLAQQICLELTVHATIEEEIFYPAVRCSVEGDMMDEAYVEHDGAKMLIAELMEGNVGDDFYDAKVKVLSEQVRHHVKEEEGRGGIFAQARKAGVDMAALGEQLAERKGELKKSIRRNGIPQPETRSMKGAEVRLGQPV